MIYYQYNRDWLYEKAMDIYSAPLRENRMLSFQTWLAYRLQANQQQL